MPLIDRHENGNLFLLVLLDNASVRPNDRNGHKKICTMTRNITVPSGPGVYIFQRIDARPSQPGASIKDPGKRFGKRRRRRLEHYMRPAFRMDELLNSASQRADERYASFDT